MKEDVLVDSGSHRRLALNEGSDAVGNMVITSPSTFTDLGEPGEPDQNLPIAITDLRQANGRMLFYVQVRPQPATRSSATSIR